MQLSTPGPIKSDADNSLAPFQAACDHAFESVLITSAKAGPDGYPIVYVNRAFTEMTGYPADAVIGLTPGILQGPKTDKPTLKRLSQDLAAGRSFHGQAINYRRDGTEFSLEWKVIPITNSQGKVTHFVSVQKELNGEVMH